MKITEALIQKFFDKQCTATEAAEISAFLKSNPEILDQYLNKSEWDNLVEGDNKTDAFWAEVWQNIEARKQQRTKVLTLKKITVAASILLVLGLGTWIYVKHTPTPETSTLVVSQKTIVNNTANIKQVILSDGSVVQLSPNSELTFHQPFQHNKRSIYLKGEAMFKVAKDKSKPFTVYSNVISTTALGTEFSVSAHDSSQQIKIHLYEGKVVVKPTAAANKKLIKDLYLLPGDELTYNKKEMWANIAHAKGPTEGKTASKETKANASLLIFDKTSLSSVFDQLAAKYRTRIHYSNSELDNLYFIGTFNQTDSLENILNNIGKLNGLKIKKNVDGGYTINK